MGARADNWKNRKSGKEYCCDRCGTLLDGPGWLCEKCKKVVNRRSRERRKEQAAAGVCTCCGRRLAAEGSRWCTECTRKAAKYRMARQEQGLCIMCGKRPARPGRTTCEDCAAAKTETELIRQDKLKASGLCIRCKKPLDRAGAYCTACTNKRKEEKRRREMRKMQAE